MFIWADDASYSGGYCMYLVLLIEYGKRIIIVDFYLSQQKINQSIIFYISNNYDSFFYVEVFHVYLGR